MQTGWGRTGEHFWGFEAHGVVPDIITFAKGLGNGLSLGGVVARAEIMDCLAANSISTFGGNPLATAAALANLEYLLEEDLQGNALRMGRRLRDGLETLAGRHPEIAEVRGKGLMLGAEMVQPGGLEPDPGDDGPRAGARPRGRPAAGQGRASTATRCASPRRSP